MTDVTVTVVSGEGQGLAKVFMGGLGPAHVTNVVDRSSQVAHPIPSRASELGPGNGELLMFGCGPVETCVRTYSVIITADRDHPFVGPLQVSAAVSYVGPAPYSSFIHVTIAAGERVAEPN